MACSICGSYFDYFDDPPIIVQPPFYLMNPRAPLVEIDGNGVTPCEAFDHLPPPEKERLARLAAQARVDRSWMWKKFKKSPLVEVARLTAAVGQPCAEYGSALGRCECDACTGFELGCSRSGFRPAFLKVFLPALVDLGDESGDTDAFSDKEESESDDEEELVSKQEEIAELVNAIDDEDMNAAYDDMLRNWKKVRSMLNDWRRSLAVSVTNKCSRQCLCVSPGMEAVLKKASLSLMKRSADLRRTLVRPSRHYTDLVRRHDYFAVLAGLVCGPEEVRLLLAMMTSLDFHVHLMNTDGERKYWDGTTGEPGDTPGRKIVDNGLQRLELSIALCRESIMDDHMFRVAKFATGQYFGACAVHGNGRNRGN